MQLTTPIEAAFRIQDRQKKALKKLGIHTLEDLLFHFPHRYGDTAAIKNIAGLQKGEDVTLYGRITKLDTKKSFRGRTPMAEGRLTDEQGASIKLIWFNQPYMAKMVQEGALAQVDGKVSAREKTVRGEKVEELSLTNPQVKMVDAVPSGVGDSLFGEEGEEHSLYPVYPESQGVTSNWMYHALQKVFKQGVHEALSDPLPDEILEHYNLPKLKTALIWIHAPKKESDARAARKRFAFEEVFFIQTAKQKAKREFRSHKAFRVEKELRDVQEFIDRFPFEATGAQITAIDRILKDFRTEAAMSRLLEGDVGSGKTAVAATAVYAVTTSKIKDSSADMQSAYMAPTEILAKQLFENFIRFFAHLGIKIGLITSSGCFKFPSKVDPESYTTISRAQLLKWIASGEISIVVGTHSLIQKSVKFRNLAFVVIDEQHRFGTAQRQKLARKDELSPHLLTMTATPIPRTLALTIYGDLDISVIDELPAGRKPPRTAVVPPAKRDATYEEIRKELDAGRQMYVICPRIDEPDPTKENTLMAKSAKEEARRLSKNVFPEYNVGVMHGKLTPKEKESVMREFEAGKTRILVSTTVVEVGVNVPNATLMIIEGAERFGLAQLHQLRGRIIRSTHQPYCYIFTESSSKKTMERLKAMQKTSNGFELAEYDLQFRGAGELYGGKQSGISDVGMEAMKNIKMVEAAREEARKLIEADANLSNHTEIQKRVAERERKLHLE